MTEIFSGGCRCGAIRYRVATKTMPPIYCCHCQDCQTWSGSAFTQQAVVGEGLIELIQGTPAVFSRTNDSGAVSTQTVCGTCHTRLWNTNTRNPAIAVIRAGTLDASETLNPRAHIWTKRKQPWVVIAQGIPNWPENAPQAEFGVALMGKRP